MTTKRSPLAHRYGYIEGYYGRLLTWDQRDFLIDHLHRERLNTYVYAPKEDPYHRRLWKRPYPQAWRRAMKRFIRKARGAGIAVVPCLAPGLSFDYRSRADYNRLLGKLSMFLDMGVSTVGLLMDDISEALPTNCIGHYVSLGEAHGELLRRIDRDISRRSPGARLWFCPTVYTDEFARTPVHQCDYLRHLSDTIPQSTAVFWTGTHVVSPTLSAASVRPITKLFGANCILWDNYFANDYCPSRLFAGPYRGRSRALHTMTRGILLNPTGLPRTDAFVLSLLAGFMRDETPAGAWHNAAALHGVPGQFASVKNLFSPFWRPSESFFTRPNLNRAARALHFLSFDWKSPLQIEWFPFVHQTEFDLSLATGDAGARSRAWVEKRYPPLQAYALNRS